IEHHVEDHRRRARQFELGTDLHETDLRRDGLRGHEYETRIVAPADRSLPGADRQVLVKVAELSRIHMPSLAADRDIDMPRRGPRCSDGVGLRRDRGLAREVAGKALPTARTQQWLAQRADHTGCDA